MCGGEGEVCVCVFVCVCVARCMYPEHTCTYTCMCLRTCTSSCIHLHITHTHTHTQAGHVCGDTVDVVDGRPTGSVRISFGYMSTCEDAERFVTFVRQNFQCRTGDEFRSNDVMVKSSDVIGQYTRDVAAKERDDVTENDCGMEGDGERGERGRKEDAHEKREREGVAVRVPSRDEEEERRLKVGDQVIATRTSSETAGIYTCTCISVCGQVHVYA